MRSVSLLSSLLLMSLMGLGGGVSTACAPLARPGSTQAIPASPEYSAWLATMENNTRHFELQHQLETRMAGTATLLSASVHDAYWREYGRIYRLTEAELQARRQAEKVQGLEVLVWTTAQDPKLASLELKAGLWQLRLVTASGEKLAPLKVERERQPDRVMTYFFPHLNPLGRTWRVYFPEKSATGGALDEGTLTLELSSVQGQVALRF
ncbi:MAG: hypothetical protein ACKO6N_19155 [Myxococcota bacterium]